MTKTKGFKIRVDLFLPIDKKDFGKQAATYQMMAAIKETGKIPAELISAAHIVSIDVKDGAGEVPDAPAVDPSEPEIPGTAEADKANKARGAKPNPDGASD